MHKGSWTILLVGAPLLYMVFSRWIWKFCMRLVSELKRGLVFLGGGLRGCSSFEKGGFLLLLGAVLAYRLYFYFSIGLTTDELCSYLYFVRPGFFISVTSYPIPNNHVFFNACCALWGMLPGLSIKAVMRLPSMVGDLFLLYCIFCLIRRWDGYRRAIVTVVGIAFCYLTSYYAVQGRGYQWQEVCVLVSAVSWWECFRGVGRGQRRGYTLFILSSVVGFYINPVFLYHFTALGLACLYYGVKEKDYVSWLFWGRCVGIITGLLMVLYMPLILASGWRSLTANPYVLGFGYKWLFAHFRDFAYILKDMTYYDVPGLCFMLGVAAALLLAYRRHIIGGVFYDNLLVYLIALSGSLTWWILCKQRYPIERSLCYWPMVLSLVFVNACYDLGRVYLGRRVYGWIAVLLLLKVAGSVRGLYWGKWNRSMQTEGEISRVEKDILELDKLHPTSWQIMDSDDYYSMYLQEYLIGKGGGQPVVFNRTKGVGDVVFWADDHPLPAPMDGYVLWEGKKLTAHGRVLRVYVLSRLMEKSEHF